MIKLDFTKFVPAQGKLLLSEPFMHDPHFRRTVVLLASHNEEGSAGFVLNRPMELSLGQVAEEFEKNNFPVWEGGPVQRDSLFYIHTLGDAIPDSIPILEFSDFEKEKRKNMETVQEGCVFWSGNCETVKALIKGNKIAENEIRFFIGYSGWSAGQLQNEIKQNSWLVAPATVELAMNAGNSTPEKLWRDVLKSMGKEYGLIANFPENPLWN